MAKYLFFIALFTISTGPLPPLANLFFGIVSVDFLMDEHEETGQKFITWPSKEIAPADTTEIEASIVD